MPLSKQDHLYLVDGSGYIFRAYHALPPLTRKSDGLPVGAVSGFCNMLLKLLEDMDAEATPTHLAVIFDASGKTFRNDIYPDYKANRSETPEDLIPQFPLVREAVKAFGIPSIELEGFEADDLIAAYADAAAQDGATVTIVSSDKVLVWLVDERVSMVDTMKDRKIGAAEVVEKFGVGPDRVIDVQSLAGDSVDNVPGVPGIGVKTAALLINEYGDLDTLLVRADEIKQTKRRENLIAFADQARISRDLVTLKKDTPLPVPVDATALALPDSGQLVGFLKAMEFNTLTRRVAKKYDLDVESFAATPDLAASDQPKPAARPEGAAQDTAQMTMRVMPAKTSSCHRSSLQPMPASPIWRRCRTGLPRRRAPASSGWIPRRTGWILVWPANWSAFPSPRRRVRRAIFRWHTAPGKGWLWRRRARHNLVNVRRWRH